MSPLFRLSNMLQQLLTVFRLLGDWQVARAVVLLDFSHWKQQPPASKTFMPVGSEPERRAEAGTEN